MFQFTLDCAVANAVNAAGQWLNQSAVIDSCGATTAQAVVFHQAVMNIHDYLNQLMLWRKLGFPFRAAPGVLAAQGKPEPA